MLYSVYLRYFKEKNEMHINASCVIQMSLEGTFHALVLRKEHQKEP